MGNKHYVDLARDLQKKLVEKNLTVAEYSRVNNVNKGAVSNLKSLLQFSDEVLEEIKRSNFTMHRTRILKRLNGKISDKELCKMIRYSDKKQFSEKMFLNFMEYIRKSRGVKKSIGYCKY